MTDREYVLACVLADDADITAPAVVLQGTDEQLDETPLRLSWARQHCRNSITIAKGANTWEEANGALVTLPNELTIVTSAYHQLRAFLTVLAVLGLQPAKVWNLPVPGSMAKLEEEFAKIVRYQEREHCVSYARAKQYLSWRNSQ